MLLHNWEIFAMNNGNSNFKWPENPVESWNKYECAFQSGVAAKAHQ